jgi:predicted Zn-dependent protease with MMP-like domain
MAKRRRGSRARRRFAPVRHEPFERIVAGVLAAIPPPFDRALDEVAVVIEDEPNPLQRRENGLAPDESLYGLYEGVPRTEWGADLAPVPNKISLFRWPLEADFPDPLDLAEEIRLTVLHELAHHLGIDDDRLGELGIE